jgi:hypothetical protein
MLGMEPTYSRLTTVSITAASVTLPSPTSDTSSTSFPSTVAFLQILPPGLFSKKVAAVRAHALEQESVQFEQLYFPQDHPNILGRFENPIKK